MGQTYSVLTKTDDSASVKLDFNNLNKVAQTLEGVDLRVTLPNNAVLDGYGAEGAQFTIPVQDILGTETMEAKKSGEELIFTLEADGVRKDASMMFELLVDGDYEDRVEIGFTQPA